MQNKSTKIELQQKGNLLKIIEKQNSLSNFAKKLYC